MMQALGGTVVSNSAEVQKSDLFSPWYTIWSIVCFLLWWGSNELDRIFGLYLLLPLVVDLPALILAVVMIIGLAINILKWRWRRIVSIIAGPVLVYSFSVALNWLGITPQLIRLELSKSSYLAQIESLPKTDGARLEFWDWDGIGGAGTTSLLWTLVYDESDHISSLPPSRLAEWASKADADWLRRADKAAKGKAFGAILHPGNFGGDSYVSVSHLDGHFYVVEELYQ